MSAIEQAAKGATDAAAVAFGAESWMCGHRHRPLSAGHPRAMERGLEDDL